MDKLAYFILLSVPLAAISRKSILKPGSHGFYRFLAWEGILWLAVNNLNHWFEDPFSLRQVVSWILLFTSLFLVIAGVAELKRSGKSHRGRNDDSLLAFEKTTELVKTGIYRHIRHPMYSSLLFLAWGIFLKHPGAGLFGIAVLTTGMLLETALTDERECMNYFGETYKNYMKITKRFIPYVF